MNIDTSIWVSQKALAEELGINPQNVHNWIKREKIAFIELPGGVVLVNKKSVRVDKQGFIKKSKKVLK